MKAPILSFIVFSTILSIAHAQDTYSIVAADSTTREVGSAGASCVDLFTAGIADPSFIGHLLPDTGAINSQASYVQGNQNNARTRMRAGDTPAQIISWVTANDVGFNPTVRQYGIVRFTGNNVNATGYTGTNCTNYKNHITGSINGIYYSIQGNILLGQQILDSMESKFRKAQGDLACRLMAALQGANVVGADTRCAANGTSALFAFVQVAQPADPYGSPSFKVTVKTHSNAQIEPVDTLQTIFNSQHSCNPTALNELTLNNLSKVYPNPSSGKITVMINNGQEISIFNLLGENILNSTLNSSRTEIDLSKETKGIYFYQLTNGSGILKTGKLILK